MRKMGGRVAVIYGLLLVAGAFLTGYYFAQTDINFPMVIHANGRCAQGEIMVTSRFLYYCDEHDAWHRKDSGR